MASVATGVMLGVSAIGMGIQAIGGIYSAQQKKETAREQAKLIEEQTRKEVEDFHEQGEALKSRQIALVGASGVKQEGSPLLVMQETARQLEEDELWIRTQGRKAAELTRKQGDAAFWSDIIGTTGTLLTSGASIYHAYSGYYGNGIKRSYQYTNKYPSLGHVNLGRPAGY